MWVGPDGVVLVPAMVVVNDSEVVEFVRRLWNLFVALVVESVAALVVRLRCVPR